MIVPKVDSLLRGQFFYLGQVEKNHRITHMMRAIAVSYLVLVDEEKHDGQNLQEEDEQEEDEELWGHREEKREGIQRAIEENRALSMTTV